MSTDKKNDQFGQGPEIDNKRNLDAIRSEGTEESLNDRRKAIENIDDDFLSGDNAPKHPDEKKYHSPSRNGSHRNHT